MGNKLPRKLELKMQKVDEQIRLARLHRDLSVAQVAERATSSPMTIILKLVLEKEKFIWM